MPRVSIPGKGWRIEVTHESGSVHRLSPAGDPVIKPTANDYQRLDIPVKANDKWLDPGFEGADITVWRDGILQPIDTLVTVDPESGATYTLKCRGGSELDTRTRKYVNVARLSDVVTDIVEDKTSYTANVDEAPTEVETVAVSDGTTEAEFDAELDVSDPTSPAIPSSNISSGDGEGFVLAQTSFWREAENLGESSVDFRGNDAGASNAEVIGLENEGSYVESGATLEHQIPEEYVGIAARFRAPYDLGNVSDSGSATQELPGITLYLDGQKIGPAFSAYAQVDPGYRWRTFDEWSGGDLEPGGHSFRVECTENASGSPDYGTWFDNTSNYDGTTYNERGKDTVNVAVGASGNGGDRAFSPPAIWIDPGTTVDWNWVDSDGYHNVVEENGVFDSGGTIQSDSYTFSHTFENEGLYRYYCENHDGDGMRGAVVVGTDYLSEQDAEMFLDGLTLFDKRYHSVPAFDNETNSNDALEYPANYPVGNGGMPTPIRAFDDVERVRAVTGATISIDVNDTAGISLLGLSNDRGESYNDSGAGVSTHSTDFSDVSGYLRWRIGLQGYGQRSDQTPTRGFQRPEVDSWVLEADLEDIPLVIDRKWDDDAMAILQELARETDAALFEIRVDEDGNWSVEWTQPGQRTTDRQDPISSFTQSKTIEPVVDQVIIKGRSLQVTDEPFTADHGTWVPLNNDEIQQGQETVVDPDTGQQFTRGPDYDLNPLTGEIKTFANGDMVDGQSYEISYQHKPKGEWTADGAGSDPDTETRTLPQLSTARACAQIARLIGEQVNEPLVEGTVEIPSGRASWTVVEAVDYDDLPIPGPHQVKNVEQSPTGAKMRIGSRETFEETFNAVRSQLETVSDTT